MGRLPSSPTIASPTAVHCLNHSAVREIGMVASSDYPILRMTHMFY
jgi:hypothetical protein